MNELDLDAILGRASASASLVGFASIHGVVSREDVPALVAEVRRLRAQVVRDETVTGQRMMIGGHMATVINERVIWDDEPFDIGEPLARHPDGTLNTDPVCICTVPKIAAYIVCPVHYRGEFLPPVDG